MKTLGFLKLLNKKINKYDKFAGNPFKPANISITLVWIDDNKSKPP